jgi:hypothetical protein
MQVMHGRYFGQEENGGAYYFRFTIRSSRGLLLSIHDPFSIHLHRSNPEVVKMAGTSRLAPRKHHQRFTQDTLLHSSDEELRSLTNVNAHNLVLILYLACCYNCE